MHLETRTNGEVMPTVPRLVFYFCSGEVSGALLKNTLYGSVIRITHGIPDDARFVRMYVDNSSQQLAIVYEHPSFSEVYESAGEGFVLDNEDCIPMVGKKPWRTCFSGHLAESLIASTFEEIVKAK